MTQKCGAERPALRPSGWECLGVGLSVVTHSFGLPVVCPTVLLGAINEGTRQEMERNGGPQPFPGGDHIHLVMTHRSAEDAIRTNSLRLI